MNFTSRAGYYPRLMTVTQSFECMMIGHHKLGWYRDKPRPFVDEVFVFSKGGYLWD